MKITRHVPTFCEGFAQFEHNATDFDGLLSAEWIKNIKQQDKFYKFSFTKYLSGNDVFILMAEFEEGKRWWVVGFIQDCKMEDINLPEWRTGK